MPDGRRFTTSRWGSRGTRAGVSATVVRDCWEYRRVTCAHYQLALPEPMSGLWHSATEGLFSDGASPFCLKVCPASSASNREDQSLSTAQGTVSVGIRHFHGIVVFLHRLVFLFFISGPLHSLRPLVRILRLRILSRGLGRRGRIRRRRPVEDGLLQLRHGWSRRCGDGDPEGAVQLRDRVRLALAVCNLLLRPQFFF